MLRLSSPWVLGLTPIRWAIEMSSIANSRRRCSRICSRTLNLQSLHVMQEVEYLPLSMYSSVHELSFRQFDCRQLTSQVLTFLSLRVLTSPCTDALSVTSRDCASILMKTVQECWGKAGLDFNDITSVLRRLTKKQTLCQ